MEKEKKKSKGMRSKQFADTPFLMVNISWATKQYVFGLPSLNKLPPSEQTLAFSHTGVAKTFPRSFADDQVDNNVADGVRHQGDTFFFSKCAFLTITFSTKQDFPNMGGGEQTKRVQ